MIDFDRQPHPKFVGKSVSVEVMATDEDLDALLARHKKEQKALIAHTTSLKKSVTKGEKAKRKEVLAEVQQLEAELKQLHERELAELQDKTAGPAGSKELNGTNDALPVENGGLPTIQGLSLEEEPEASITMKGKGGKPKANRQKARMVFRLEDYANDIGKESGRIGGATRAGGPRSCLDARPDLSRTINHAKSVHYPLAPRRKCPTRWKLYVCCLCIPGELHSVL